MAKAVAIDLGATSGRFALGTLLDGRIDFEVIEQIPHAPISRDGRLEWDIDSILGLCHRAVAFAQAHGARTVGIDSWGVDVGYLDSDGTPLQEPICYRDPSHSAASDGLSAHHDRLFELTGIQNQPFNTLFQLMARRQEDASFPAQAQWLLLPDYLGYRLGGRANYEMTEASTTGLMALDGTWCAEAFELVGWPIPTLAPQTPGQLGAEIADGVWLATVGSHDTASAVAGFGLLADDQAFVNVGTWSLAGTVIDAPIATAEAREMGFTNERTVDGRVRLLKNIPGFYVINRLHEELAVAVSVPEWLSSARPVGERLDLTLPDFYNPESMVAACCGHLQSAPASQEEWAGLALGSLASTVAATVPQMERLTGRQLRSFRVGGGGSQSAAFCQALASAAGIEIQAGPAEVTVLGNLAAQFLAAGEFSSWDEALQTVRTTSQPTSYLP